MIRPGNEVRTIRGTGQMDSVGFLGSGVPKGVHIGARRDGQRGKRNKLGKKDQTTLSGAHMRVSWQDIKGLVHSVQVDNVTTAAVVLVMAKNASLTRPGSERFQNTDDRVDFDKRCHASDCYGRGSEINAYTGWHHANPESTRTFTSCRNHLPDYMELWDLFDVEYRSHRRTFVRNERKNYYNKLEY